MIKMFIAFCVIFSILYFGIPEYRHLKGKEKLDLFKLIAYSFICAGLTLAFLVLLVVLF